MRKCCQKVSFKPIDVKNAVTQESGMQKVRLVVFGVLMGTIATTFQTFYDGVAYRSAQLQREALAGKREFVDFTDKDSPDVWFARQTLKLLEEKPFKEVKYLVEGWADRSETTELPDGTTTTSYFGPNGGDPYANPQYFTQDDEYTEAMLAYTLKQERQVSDPIVWAQEQYDQWVKMTEGTIWFDTAACRASPHSFGRANRAFFYPTTTRYIPNPEDPTREYTNTETGETVTLPNYVPIPTANGLPSWSPNSAVTVQETGELEPNLSPSRPVYRAGADSAVGVVPGGKIDVYNEDLFINSLTYYIELVDECDIDCQQKGSQVTLAATLSAIPYGFAGLNALFMIIGAWSRNCRLCSIWCTLCVFIFQFAILIVTGTMIFSKYSLGCFGALTPTAGEGVQWTMSDDMYSMAYLYLAGWFALFVFLCCGWCQIYHPETKK